ncbi:4-phosphopantetheinyl transferase [Streptomyces sp. NBC_01485]|uniref:4'-phosphopantetheinyl transferase family protein n=1 Tax=Streptomyces sp. NBC_01485 TaxID=2903884 RepID=UPI002E319C0B|nr:4-phosphopantetheinyl transferase [Streptomyces sp. NBC_01485]
MTEPAAEAISAPVTVADEVWVAVAALDRVAPSGHRDDRLRAVALPEWRAAEFLAGRGLLRELLAAVRPRLADRDVVTDVRGKPRLRGRPGVGVSVSHSRGTVAVAVAVGRELGVDVQQPRETVSATLTRRLLGEHARDLTGLSAAGVAREAAWVWTAQEACVKAGGEGLRGRPWSIDVPQGARAGHWGDYRWVSLREHSAIPLSCAFGRRSTARSAQHTFTTGKGDRQT